MTGARRVATSDLAVGRTILDGQWERTAEQRKVCHTLEKVAGEVGVESITAGAYSPVLVDFTTD